MISSKVLALSLLLVSPFALARIQLHTQAELKSSKHYGNHSADITFQIDAHESLEVYNHGNVKVVAELLAEEETNATACFSIYAKNAAGEYEKISAPVIVPNYTEPAMISMGSTDGEIFTMTVKAQKV
ncbi:MAG: hypothetical protein AMXMBFR12_08280 [Candidatus Babeliales bacterium]